MSLDLTYLSLNTEIPLYSEDEVIFAGQAVQLVGNYLTERNREYTVVIPVDTKCRPINVAVLGAGDVAHSAVYVAEIVKHVLLSNAYGFYMMHNHPSGEVTPSKDDVNLTASVIDATKHMGLPLLDHIIVGKNYKGMKYYSMRGHGKMNLKPYVKPGTVHKEEQLRFSDFTFEEPLDKKFAAFTDRETLLQFLNKEEESWHGICC